eukprot:UN01511
MMEAIFSPRTIFSSYILSSRINSSSIVLRCSFFISELVSSVLTFICIFVLLPLVSKYLSSQCTFVCAFNLSLRIAFKTNTTNNNFVSIFLTIHFHSYMVLELIGIPVELLFY